MPTNEELKDYACGKCAIRGVKLWRLPHRALSSKHGCHLLCAVCLVPGKVVDSAGRLRSEDQEWQGTDQVDGWLPAVPSDDTFWGYSSVPQSEVDWWKALPTYEDYEKDVP